MKHSVFIILVSFALFGCGESTPSNFEQVGYFKNDNKLRYFTYQVADAGNSTTENISKELLASITQHGSRQMHTEGKVTAAFYYIKPNQAPNISNLAAQAANDMAHQRSPVVAIWQMPNGQTNVIQNPE